MRDKIVQIGAGSAMFTRGLAADLINRGIECELALVDTDPEALEVAERLVQRMVEAKGASIKVSASTDRRSLLSNAAAVICTVGVGGRRAWEHDVFIPRKFGIYQPVGDSVMPGGSSRALRMIPAMVSIAKDVLDLAPDTLFFNYGNPMAPVCRGVRKATGANITGLCHGVFHVAHYLAHLLNVDVSNLKYTAVGMNHLTWFIEVNENGCDAMPRLRKIAAEKLAEVNSPGGKSDVESINPFSWHLFQLFGAFPAVLDRHITEFFPSFFSSRDYYGGKLGVDRFSFEDTIAGGDRIFEEMRQDAFSKKPLGQEYFNRIGGEHEQVLDIIDSIRTGAGRIYSANLPNRGQVPNIPQETIVEAPAIAGRDGLVPVPQKPLPAGTAGTLASRFAWVEVVVEAALEGRRDKFVQALVIDGSVDSLETAEKIADELLLAHEAFLPQFFPAGSAEA